MIILVEGFDGLGKTTLISALAAKVDGVSVATPSASPLGQLIRDRQDTAAFEASAMAHLYIADQLDTAEPLLRRAARARRHVLLDRHCMTSGPAYRPDPWGMLWQTLRLSNVFVRPDLGVVLEGSPELVRDRLALKQEPCLWTDAEISAISTRLTGYVQRFARKTVTISATMTLDDQIAAIFAAAEGV